MGHPVLAADSYWRLEGALIYIESVSDTWVGYTYADGSGWPGGHSRAYMDKLIAEGLLKPAQPPSRSPGWLQQIWDWLVGIDKKQE